MDRARSPLQGLDPERALGPTVVLPPVATPGRTHRKPRLGPPAKDPVSPVLLVAEGPVLVPVPCPDQEPAAPGLGLALALARVPDPCLATVTLRPGVHTVVLAAHVRAARIRAIGVLVAARRLAHSEAATRVHPGACRLRSVVRA